MASLTKNGKNYGLIWTDSSRTPSQVRESLKTQDRNQALQKKNELEWKYHNRDNLSFPESDRHDPWKQKWYEQKADEGKTVAEAVEEFIRFKSRARGQQGWSDTAQRNETYTMRKFARHVGNILLEDLKKEHLEGFYYRDKVNSDHTRNSLYISVNTFLNWCIDQGYLEEKPVFKPKKPQTKVPKFIRLDEVRTMYEAEDWEYVRYGWLLLVSTGMRPAELANLKLAAINNNHLLIGEDFTTKVRAERRIPFLFETEFAIEKLTDSSFNRSYSPEYLLGRSPKTTKPILSQRFSKLWGETFPRKKRALYNLKDTFAVRFLSDDSLQSRTGMKLNDLKEILGHASLSTTQRYLKAIPYGTDLSGSLWDYKPIEKEAETQ